jgi:hypothetical protein
MREPRTGVSHRHWQGVCHRCGWSGAVSRVGLRDRRRFGGGMAFGRLCDDCANTLLGLPQVQVKAPSPSRMEPLHHPRVA